MAKPDDDKKPEEPPVAPIARSFRGGYQAASLIKHGKDKPLIKVGDPITSNDLPPGEFDRLVNEGHIVEAKR